MGIWTRIIPALVVGLATAACGTGTSSTPRVTAADDAAPATRAPATTAPVADGATTTSEAVGATFTELDVGVEPSGWEDVTITTEDGIDLYGRFWAGGDKAVLFGHDFDNPNPGSSGQRAPQSSEAVLPFAAAIANEGVTLLAIDFRGHGQSEGEYDVQASQQDLAAAYRWLVDAGHETIVMVGWVGSGTAATVLDAESDEVDFAGIAMLFSPPQDTGLDADRVMAEIETPMLFIGSEAGRSASWSRRMEAKAGNSYGVHVFEQVPTGVQFIDVFGGELAGRIYDFIQSV